MYVSHTCMPHALYSYVSWPDPMCMDIDVNYEVCEKKRCACVPVQLSSDRTYLYFVRGGLAVSSMHRLAIR